MKTLKITSEDDFFEAVEHIKNNPSTDDIEVFFENWPRFEIVVQGEHFDGGVPTRIMPAFLELQKAINTAYSEYKYGGVKKNLSKEEKEQLEIVVYLQSGRSTAFSSELWTVLNKMVSNMTGEESVTAILGVAGILGLSYVLVNYWKTRLEERSLDNRVSISEQETKRLEIVKDIIKENRFEGFSEKMESAYKELGRRLNDNDNLVIRDDQVIGGADAHLALRKPREQAVESRIDGAYAIHTVDSGSVQGGFRLLVVKENTEEFLRVDIPEGTLNQNQVKILQSGEWGKKPVKMQINIRKIGNSIKKATLIQAGLSR